MNAARACSRSAVMSRPPSRIRPLSSKNVPATAFSKVDFPDPLVPITMTNEPSSIARSTPCKAFTSLGVCAKKVLVTCCSSSMRSRLSAPLQPRQQSRQDQRYKHEQRRHQLEVVGIEPGAQRQRDQQAEEDRAH